MELIASNTFELHIPIRPWHSDTRKKVGKLTGCCILGWWSQLEWQVSFTIRKSTDEQMNLATLLVIMLSSCFWTLQWCLYHGSLPFLSMSNVVFHCMSSDYVKLNRKTAVNLAKTLWPQEPAILAVLLESSLACSYLDYKSMDIYVVISCEKNLTHYCGKANKHE